MRRARGYAAVTYWALVVFVAAWAGAWAQGNAGLSTDVGTPRKLAPRDQTEPKEQKKVRINHADRARYDSARKMFYLYRDRCGRHHRGGREDRTEQAQRPVRHLQYCSRSNRGDRAVLREDRARECHCDSRPDDIGGARAQRLAAHAAHPVADDRRSRATNP